MPATLTTQEKFPTEVHFALLQILLPSRSDSPEITAGVASYITVAATSYIRGYLFMHTANGVHRSSTVISGIGFSFDDHHRVIPMRT